MGIKVMKVGCYYFHTVFMMGKRYQGIGSFFSRSFVALLMCCVAASGSVSLLPYTAHADATSVNLTRVAQDGSDLSLSFSYSHAYELNSGLKDLSLEYSATGEDWAEFAYLFLWLNASTDATGEGNGGHTNLTVNDGYYRLRVKDSGGNSVYSNEFRYPSLSEGLHEYRYFKWEITKKKGIEVCGDTGSCVQVSEFGLMLGGEPVVWPGTVSAENPGGMGPPDEGAGNVIDGNTATKWLDWNFRNDPNEVTGTSVLQIDAGARVVFDAYHYATGNDAPERDPVSWSFYGSNDGESWTILDSVEDADVSDTRLAYTEFTEFSPEGHHAGFVDGDGSEEDPYHIDSCPALQAMQEHLDAFYVLIEDIDCAATATWNEDEEHEGMYFGFEPIGTSDTPFTGGLDGGGHAVTGLYMHYPDGEDVGLFGFVSGGEVHDLTLENAHILGKYSVGGFVGRLDGGHIDTVELDNAGEGSVACDVEDDSIGHCVWARLGAEGGGVVGYMETGTIQYATTTGAVKGSGNTIGGLVGSMEGGALYDSASSADVDGGYSIGGAIGEMSGGIVERVSASGSVSADVTEVKNGSGAGGLVGAMLGGDIEDSHATGDVSADTGDAGGFAGYMQGGIIVQSYATGDVSVNVSRGGGFAGGIDSGIISEAYALGDVEAPDAFDVGGFVGTLYNGELDQVYAFGNVVGASTVGGFAGYTWAGTTTNAYARGAVTGSANTVGGFVGGHRAFIEFAYASGEVTGVAEEGSFSIGGFAGDNDGVIENAFSAGPVTAPDYIQVGGFIGYHGAGASIVDVGWWTGSHEFAIGSDNTLDANAETIDYFKDPAAGFYQWGWDLENIWAIDEGEVSRLNAGWPYLRELSDSYELESSPIAGCTDPEAENYDEEATDNDGSCTYDEPVEFAGGDGTDGSPYQIETCEQLQGVNEDLDASYILISDIDCAATATWNESEESEGVYFGFVPLGDLFSAGPFTGDFDGSEFTISGLQSHWPTFIGSGLFGTVEGGSIYDLTLDSISISGIYNVGGLAGLLLGANVAHVHVTSDVSDSTITAPESVMETELPPPGFGGFVGSSYESYIEYSSSDADVVADSEGEFHTGGFVGFTDSGIFGGNQSFGDVSGGNAYTGGFVGSNEGADIYYSSASGDVSGQNGVGGYVGTNSGLIAGAYSRGYVVTGDGVAMGVGGFAGENDGDIHEAYTTSELTVLNPEEETIGAFVGLNSGGIGPSFWNVEVENNWYGCGIASSDCDAVFGATTEDLQRSRTFLADLGGDEWDWDMWGISNDENDGYPSYRFNWEESSEEEEEETLEFGIVLPYAGGTTSAATPLTVVADGGICTYVLDNGDTQDFDQVHGAVHSSMLTGLAAGPHVAEVRCDFDGEISTDTVTWTKLDASNHTLYAADGAGSNSGAVNLYILDPETGERLETVGEIGNYRITGMAFHPDTGVLYASSGGSNSFPNPKTLFVISPETAEATRLGRLVDEGGTAHTVADIVFSPDGILYGWSEISDDLVTIDIDSCDGTTCLVTVYEGDLETAGSGITFDADGRLLQFGNGDESYFEIDPSDGSTIEEYDFLGPSEDIALNAATTDASGMIFVSRQSFDLIVIDPVSGVIASTDYENPDMQYIDALAFRITDGDGEIEEEPEEETQQPTRSGGSSLKRKTLNQLKRYVRDGKVDFLDSYVKKNSTRIERYYKKGAKLPDEVMALLNLGVRSSTVSTPSSKPTFPVRDQELGLSGDDVRALQTLLISLNSGPATSALAGVGATGYFGAYTQSAVAEYQRLNGIIPALGYFGPKTRTHMKAASVTGIWW